jgi:hypothetical protein
MKYAFLLVSAAFLVVGCQQKITPVAPPQNVEPKKAEPAPTPQPAPQPPPVPDVQPVIPANPTIPFTTGYHDGFYGSWLAPLRFAALNEYRHGWAAGAYDRKHGIPNRFDTKRK